MYLPGKFHFKNHIPFLKSYACNTIPVCIYSSMAWFLIKHMGEFTLYTCSHPELKWLLTWLLLSNVGNTAHSHTVQKSKSRIISSVTLHCSKTFPKYISYLPAWILTSNISYRSYVTLPSVKSPSPFFLTHLLLFLSVAEIKYLTSNFTLWNDEHIHVIFWHFTIKTPVKKLFFLPTTLLVSNSFSVGLWKYFTALLYAVKSPDYFVFSHCLLGREN
jgi:hypothetical protein